MSKKGNSITGLALGTILSMAAISAAAQEQNQDLLQMPFVSNAEGALFVIYDLAKDDGGNWTLKSQFYQSGIGGGRFDMGSGTAMQMAENTEDLKLVDELSAQCKASFDGITSGYGEDTKFFMGQDSADENKTRLVIYDDNENWALMQFLKTPNGANRCIEGLVDRKPPRMIPGTNIPFPNGEERLARAKTVVPTWRARLG
jgi:hypothetical protein